MARDDGREILQGADQPIAQEARAHRGARGVEGFQQGGGGVRARCAAGGNQLQIGERGFVEHHGIRGGSQADAADVAGRTAQVTRDVVQEGTGGSRGGRVAGAAEAIQRLHA